MVTVCDLMQADKLMVDSTRFALEVLHDPVKPLADRFAWSLYLKQYVQMDTSLVVTRNLTITKQPWEPWVISGVAVVLLILQILYGH